MHVGNLLRNRGAAPAMNFKGRIAHLQTSLGKIGKRFGRGEAVRLVIAMIGAGITGDASLVAAQQFIKWLVVELAGQIPQRNVDRCVADTCHLAQGAAHIGINALALQRTVAEQVVDKTGQGGILGRATPGILAHHTSVGEDAQHATSHFGLRARFVDQVEAVVIFAQVGQRPGIFVNLDAGNFGIRHFFLQVG